MRTAVAVRHWLSIIAFGSQGRTTPRSAGVGTRDGEPEPFGDQRMEGVHLRNAGQKGKVDRSIVSQHPLDCEPPFTAPVAATSLQPVSHPPSRSPLSVSLAVGSCGLCRRAARAIVWTEDADFEHLRSVRR